jgi:hypothetical protein
MESLDRAIAILEQMIAMTKANREKTEARIETCQEQINAEIKTDLEDVEATDLEANPEETEAVVELQEITNEKAAIHSLREWRKETMACQETTEARLECKEPTSEDMEPETEHQEKMDAWIADMNCGLKRGRLAKKQQRPI